MTARSKWFWFNLVVVVGSGTTVSAFTVPNNNNRGAGKDVGMIQSTIHHGGLLLSPRRHATTSRTQLSMTAPRALATEGDWTAYLDEDSTGLVYYFNGKTGESLWEPPTNTFPIVNLPDDMRVKAEEKRLAYIKTVQEREKMAVATAASVQKEQPSQQQKGGEKWFDFLFDDSSEQAVVQEPEPEPKETAVVQEEEPNWFANFFEAAAKSATEVAEKAAESMKEEVSTVVEAPAPAPVVIPKKKEEKKIEVVEPQVTPIKLEMATCVLPHPQKIFWGGEDAVFTAGRTFGIFDGVSGARKLDGVPLYSKTLANEMKRKCKEDKGLSVQDMTKFLQEAREVADKKSTGASTALVASITEDGFLRALNVGDSTCIVIRNGRVVSRTREINHFFECPYQLSTDSPDQPRDGTKMNLELVRGDIIIMGSDGVFDNLSDKEIIESLSQEDTTRLGRVAKRLADKSRQVSLNRNAETPYARLAKKNGDPDYQNGLGGKVDDVSCVVVRYA